MAGVFHPPRSAPDAIYRPCCIEFLFVDPQQPKAEVDDIVLKPWQVTGASWFLFHEEGALRFRVLADDVGLGKTLTALLVIFFGTVRNQLVPDFSSYKATLIIVPFSILHTWIDESRRCLPSLEIWTLYPGATMDGTRGFESLPELMKCLRKLDPKDAKTGKTFVLSTYSAWEKLSMVINEESREKRHDMDKIPTMKRKSNYAVQDAIALADYEFCRIILDEGGINDARNPTSRANVSLQLTKAESMLFISATPFDHSVKEIYGLLALMRNYMPPPPPTPMLEIPTRQHYEQFCQLWDRNVRTFTASIMYPDLDYPDYLHYLAKLATLEAAESDEAKTRPLEGFYDAKGSTASSRYGLFLFQQDTVRAMFDSAIKENGNRLPVALLKSFLGALMRPLSLKRNRNTYLDIGTQTEPYLSSVGYKIPESTWHVVDVAMSAADDHVYQTNFAFLHDHRTTTLHTKEEDHQGSRHGRHSSLDQGIDRLLTIAASSLPLATLARRMELIRHFRRPASMEKLTAASVRITTDKYDKQASLSDRYPLPFESKKSADHNTTFFLKLLNTAAHYTSPSSRVDAAKQLTRSSVKLQFAARRILEEPNQRLIIYARDPITQMLLEALAATMEIEVSLVFLFFLLLLLLQLSSAATAIYYYYCSAAAAAAAASSSLSSSPPPLSSVFLASN